MGEIGRVARGEGLGEGQRFFPNPTLHPRTNVRGEGLGEGQRFSPKPHPSPNNQLEPEFYLIAILYSLAPANALVEIDSRRRRFDVQLGAQRLDASLILAQRQMLLALAAIATHEPAVRVFATVVIG